MDGYEATVKIREIEAQHDLYDSSLIFIFIIYVYSFIQTSCTHCCDDWYALIQ